MSAAPTVSQHSSWGIYRKDTRHKLTLFTTEIQKRSIAPKLSWRAAPDAPTQRITCAIMVATSVAYQGSCAIPTATPTVVQTRTTSYPRDSTSFRPFVKCSRQRLPVRPNHQRAPRQARPPLLRTGLCQHHHRLCLHLHPHHPGA